jgi:hypothetical protein
LLEQQGPRTPAGSCSRLFYSLTQRPNSTARRTSVSSLRSPICSGRIPDPDPHPPSPRIINNNNNSVPVVVPVVPRTTHHPASAGAGAGRTQGTSRVGIKSVVKFFVAATAGCQGTKTRVFASEPAQTHHARTTTHNWHHTDQCYSLGVHWWRLGSRLQLRNSRGGRSGPRTPPKRRSAAGTALGRN